MERQAAPERSDEESPQKGDDGIPHAGSLGCMHGIFPHQARFFFFFEHLFALATF